MFNVFHTGIGDLNPVLWGCRMDFNSRVNGLKVYYCNLSSLNAREMCHMDN